VGLAALTGVLATRGAVAVRPAAGAVVIVVGGVVEVALAAITVADQRLTAGRTRSECHRDGVTGRVGTTHRFAPVTVCHDALLKESIVRMYYMWKPGRLRSGGCLILSIF